MAIEQPLPTQVPTVSYRYESLSFTTNAPQQFIDITDAVTTCCRHSRIAHGTVTIQSRHTTAAVVIQENEPLLLQDLNRMLDGIAPGDLHYCHNDLDRRSDVPPDERANGHAHARALILPSSVQVIMLDGCPELGRWQRLFLVELDGPRERHLSVMVLGLPAGPPLSAAARDMAPSGSRLSLVQRSEEDAAP